MKPIQTLFHEDKPREKLLRKGASALKNDELIALLLGSGVKGKDIRKLSREIVSLLDREFLQITPEALLKIHGLGIAKASQIIAAIELSRRYLLPEYRKRRISSADQIYEALSPYAAKNREHFLSITLDGASRIIRTRTVFIGTLNQSLVHPREVFADVIEDRAAGLIIAHNHPSGNLEASHADIQVTRRLKEVADLIGIELLDHLILSKEGYLSFSEEGLPPFG